MKLMTAWIIRVDFGYSSITSSLGLTVALDGLFRPQNAALRIARSRQMGFISISLNGARDLRVDQENFLAKTALES
jgi:hypothetical protein